MKEGFPGGSDRMEEMQRREAEALKALFSVDPVLRGGWIQGHQDSTPPYFLTFLQGTIRKKGVAKIRQ